MRRPFHLAAVFGAALLLSGASGMGLARRDASALRTPESASQRAQSGEPARPTERR